MQRLRKLKNVFLQKDKKSLLMPLRMRIEKMIRKVQRENQLKSRAMILMDHRWKILII